MSEKLYDERGREQVAAWYGIAITTNKEKLIRSRIQELSKTDMWKDQIFDAILPSYMDLNNKGKEIEKLHYTQIGYVHMILNSDTWNALEMLRGIGFRAILPAGAAQPIPDHEMESIFRMIGRDIPAPLGSNVALDLELGQKVKIIDPSQQALFGQIGSVVELFEKELLISIDLIGKETKVRVKYNQIEKESNEQ